MKAVGRVTDFNSVHYDNMDDAITEVDRSSDLIEIVSHDQISVRAPAARKVRGDLLDKISRELEIYVQWLSPISLPHLRPRQKLTCSSQAAVFVTEQNRLRLRAAFSSHQSSNENRANDRYDLRPYLSAYSSPRTANRYWRTRNVHHPSIRAIVRRRNESTDVPATCRIAEDKGDELPRGCRCPVVLRVDRRMPRCDPWVRRRKWIRLENSCGADQSTQGEPIDGPRTPSSAPFGRKNKLR